MSDSREIIPHPEQHSDAPESPEERQRHATEVIPEIIDPDRKPGGDIDKPVDPDLRNYRKAADESSVGIKTAEEGPASQAGTKLDISEDADTGSIRVKPVPGGSE